MCFFLLTANLLSAVAGCFVFAAVFDSAIAREREKEGGRIGLDLERGTE